MSIANPLPVSAAYISTANLHLLVPPMSAQPTLHLLVPPISAQPTLYLLVPPISTQLNLCKPVSATYISTINPLGLPAGAAYISTTNPVPASAISTANLYLLAPPISAQLTFTC